MSKQHKEGCGCEICQNNIRDERQYAAMKVGERFVIMEAGEVALIDNFLETRCEGEKQPVFPCIEPEEGGKPVLAYGVLIPQYDSGEKNWTEELEKYKDYAFGTVIDEKLYLSAYREFELFEEQVLYGTHIPCALLMDTCIDLTQEREYGFGRTAFLIYQDMGILDNMLNREFLFCIGGIEEVFHGDDLSNWTKYINTEKLMKTAKRLF